MLGNERANAAPNFVFIITDDMNLADMAYMPNVNSQLIAQGANFVNSFTVDGLCCPSRVSTLTGQYAHNHGVYLNQPPDGAFDKFYLTGGENSTLATWLQGAGYRTMLVGKYLNSYPMSTNQTYVPPGWSEWYGYMQGGDAFNYWLNENGTVVHHGSPTTVIETEYTTDVFSRITQDFITRSVSANTPFFAYVSALVPHSPATPAPRHAALFSTTKAPRPSSFNELDVTDKPLWLRNQKRMTTAAITDNDNLYKSRLQSLQAVDEMVGGIVATLTNLGALNNTYIIFTSDQGLLMGEHRLSNTKGAAYEEVIHIPFVVRGPGVAAASKPTRYYLNIDTAPSLLALAGVTSIPTTIDGMVIDLKAPGSAKPISSRGDDPNRFLVEQVIDLNTSTLFLPAFNAAKTSRYTYMEYNTLEKELYDNSKDPYQIKSIHTTASASLLQQLSVWINSLVTCKGASCQTGR